MSLKNIDDILNFIGDFEVSFQGRDIHLIGCLTKRNDNIVLECRANEDHAELFHSSNELQIYGSIACVDVTLLRSHVDSARYIGIGNDCGMLTITPTEIVIGRKVKTEVKVSVISSHMKDLNKMLTGRAFETNYDLTKDNPSMFWFAFPEAITVVDNNGKLSVGRKFDMSNGRDGVEIQVIPYVNFIFSTPVEIHEAMSKIASVRNLFSFFADYYLPLNDFTFGDYATLKEYGDDYCDCKLILNYNENIKTSDKPFLLCSNAFEGSFQQIWDKWQIFYKESEPISALFFEMICNRSTRNNRFLNLCQCLEVFSTHYRNEESRLVREKYPPVPERPSAALREWLTLTSPLIIQTFGISDNEAESFLTLLQKQHPFVIERKPVTLKHRLEDLFLYLNQYLLLPEEKCIELADTISKTRNYFTHYGKGRKEPSFECITSASRFLHLVLLLTIYDWLGVPKDSIVERIKHTHYRNIDLEAITI